MPQNANNALPLQPFNASTRIAVIGPFADCSSLAGGYGGHDSDSSYPPVCNYGHSYSGFMSSVSTYLTAAQEEASASGATVTYVAGSGIKVISTAGGGYGTTLEYQKSYFYVDSLIFTVQVDANGGPEAAAAAASTADVVVLCVGLGTVFEVEGNDRRYEKP